MYNYVVLNIKWVGNKLMGRPKGSKNVTTNLARYTFAKLKCDPMAMAIRCADELYEDGEKAKAGAIYADLISYIAPKLKAIEVSQNPDSPVSFNITIGSAGAVVKHKL
jgi:hypothetical protein